MVLPDGLLLSSSTSGNAWWVDATGKATPHAFPGYRLPGVAEELQAVPIRRGDGIWLAGPHLTGRPGWEHVLSAPPATPRPELALTPSVPLAASGRRPEFLAFGDGRGPWRGASMRVLRSPVPRMLIEAPALDGGTTLLAPIDSVGAGDSATGAIVRVPRLLDPSLGALPACGPRPSGVRVELATHDAPFHVGEGVASARFSHATAVIFVEPGRACVAGWVATHHFDPGNIRLTATLDARALDQGTLVRDRDGVREERRFRCGG